MYKLCVFAGTTEGRELVEFLSSQNLSVTACVATEYGETLLTPRANLTISAQRLTREEMQALFSRENFDMVIDATHPYAVQVTKSIRTACAAAEVPYRRLLRRDSGEAGEAITVDSAAEAAERLLRAFPGCGVTAEGLPGQLRLQSTTASGRVFAIRQRST